MSMGIFKKFNGWVVLRGRINWIFTGLKILQSSASDHGNLGGCQREKQKTPGSDAEGF